ncbi:MAG: TonB-dependent receptor [Paludibacter sp.]|nr:TonB-dependent receptor [Paludibacter sp.]
MKKIVITSVIILLTLIAGNLHAAEPQVITGVVLDERNQPAVGVNILIKGEAKGVATDANGKFSIAVNPKNVLVISYLGYITQEQIVGSKKSFVFVLKEDTKILDEVVVVGYGTMRRKDLTGAVSSLGEQTFKDIPVANIADALTGQIAGVNVTKSQGGPDSQASIKIRGAGSLNNDNSPLYIVDGFPVDDISNISPQTISSIDVLKDASSTAIYGARGANGVIIINTKSGFEGKTTITYTGFMGFSQTKKFAEVLNPFEYVFSQYEGMALSTISGTRNIWENDYGSLSDINIYKSLKGKNYQKYILGNTGTTYSNNLSVSGGTQTVRYTTTFTNQEDKDVMIGSSSNLTTITGALSFDATKWLKFYTNVFFSNKDIYGAGTSTTTYSGSVGSPLSAMIQFRPVNGVSDFVDNADILQSAYWIVDPVGNTEDSYRRYQSITTRFSAAAVVTLSKALSFRSDYSFQFGDRPIQAFYGQRTSQARASSQLPNAMIAYYHNDYWRLSNVLNYRKNIKRHNITAMFGEELVYSGGNSTLATILNFPANTTPQAGLSSAQIGKPNPIRTNESTPITTSSLFTRLNYDYKSKYIVNASIRADGSSKFAPSKRWGLFPSVGVAWRASSEEFMSSMNSWLQDLKVRASWGQSGNDRIAADSWQNVMTYGSSNSVFLGSDKTIPTAYLVPASMLYNPDLKWETTTSTNIGLDFSCFDGRLSLTVDVYEKRVSDLLLNAVIPYNTGYTTQYQNIGQTSNKGIELSLKSKLIKAKKFNMDISANIAFNRNNIDNLGATKSWTESSQWGYPTRPTNDYLIQEGKPMGQMYGYVYDGLYTFDDFQYSNSGSSALTNYYTIKPGIPSNRVELPGSPKYKDLNHDGKIDENDKTIIGNAFPLATGGFTLSMSYKNFDFSSFFNWSYGNDIYNANTIVFTSSNRQYVNMYNSMNSNNRFVYVDPNNPELITIPTNPTSVSTPGLIVDPISLYEINKNKEMASFTRTRPNDLSTLDIEDGSFLRLNTMTLGYSLPNKLVKKASLSQVRFYVVVYNPFVWTRYSGDDPEVSLAGSQLTPGIDWNAYPRSRSFNFGINIKL